MNRLCVLFLVQIGIALLFSCNHDTQHRRKTVNLTKDTFIKKEIVNFLPVQDQSPMDMAYDPADYPVMRMNGTDSSGPVARVIYSRPHKRGRVIFGQTDKSLCPYGKEWRLGANEATEIEFFRPVKINGRIINKGRYIMYCIPFPNQWTIILNSNLFSWGLHMDNTKDIFKTVIPTMEQSPAAEDFTMVFLPAPDGAHLLIAWDNVKVLLPISYSK